MEDVKFSINKDESDKISGFTLLGVGNCDSECFCLSFMIAQGLGKASVSFETGKIIFQHEGVTDEDSEDHFDIYTYHRGGKHVEEIDSEDKEDLESLMNLSGKYENKRLSVRPELAWGKGFTLSIQ